MKLQDKVAVITGGSKGIGRGCARVFAKHGCTVIIAARGAEAGHRTVQEIREQGGSAHFETCDVTSEQDMLRVIDGAASKFDRLDCIVNNAGWHPPAVNLADITVADFEALLRMNLTSTFMGCKFAAPHLEKTEGSIINLSSEVALLGQSQAASYAATKGGQVSMTRALAIDLAPKNVRVNAVCPAGVDTPLMREWAATLDDPDDALKTAARVHPLGRMATIDEIGEVCAFLASAEASFITGQAITPDGGAMLGYATKSN